MNQINKETSITSLESMMGELLSSTNAVMVKKVEKCQQLLKELEPTEVGILNKFRLDGQVALITGAGGQGGIGRGFAHALGEAGCKVAVADINFEGAETVAAELKAKGIESIAIKVDVSRMIEVEAMVKKVLDTWGDLHIACNNAGVVAISNSEETSETEWSKTMGVNLDGVFYCCQAEAKHMLGKGYGKIINTASICAHISVRHSQVAYNTSKAGVGHLTRTLGAEWAPHGVRVNAISPGYTETPLIQAEELDPLKVQWRSHTPMGRLGQVDDLVGAVVFLASPASDYMTGKDLVIDGGLTCW